MELSLFSTQLIIQPETVRRLWVYTCAAKTEISALGEASLQENGLVCVGDQIQFLKQEDSTGHTELFTKDLADTIAESVEKGTYNPALGHFWFHTHCDFTAFFSGIDIRTIERIFKTNEFIVAAVFNTHGETRWRIINEKPSFDIEFEYNITEPRPTQEELASAQEHLKQFVISRPAQRFSQRYLTSRRWDIW